MGVAPRQHAKLRAKRIHHASKLIQRALKKAKQFSVRKLGRRLATARDGSDTALGAKLQRQMDIVKTADLEVLTAAVVARELPADGANETGASPVGARVEDTLEKQLVNAKCVRVVMAQVTAQIADVNNREAATMRSRERKKRTGNAGDAGGAGRQAGTAGDQESGTTSKQIAKAPDNAMMENDVKEPATKTPHKNRVGQRERRRLAVLEHGAHANHVLQVNEGVVPAVASPPKKRNKPAVSTRPVTGGAEHAESHEPLHPSWEAKKKQRVAITAAVGARAQNKKVFGEDGDATQATPVVDGSARAAHSTRAPASPSPRKARGEPAPVDGDVHPSWLAKQKQKQQVADMLKSAKGSRIVFD